MKAKRPIREKRILNRNCYSSSYMKVKLAIRNNRGRNTKIIMNVENDKKME